jgi:hypothetical protein
LSSIAVISSSSAAMRTPNGSRFDQRLIEATQSTARTFSPSWNTRPSRSVMRQRSLSSDSS